MQRHVYRMLPAWTLLALLWARPSGCQSVKTNNPLLNDVLVALDKGVAYLSEDYSGGNVDELFGIRFCQGNLIQTLNDCSQPGFSCPSDLVQKINATSDLLSKYGVKAMPYIKENDELYFSRFSGIVDAPYLVRYTPERLEPFPVTPFNSSVFDFHLGDICFSSLLGTFVDNGRKVPVCTIKDYCWDYMTRDDTSDYYATHQLLYFIVAQQTGCQKELEEILEKSGVSVRDVQRRLCASIYSEAIVEEREGKVHTRKQDLFIEQTLLCGVLGFEDFLIEKWVRMVLSWQNPEGCFMTFYPLSNLMDEWFPPYLLFQHYTKRAETGGVESASAGRKLLNEKLIHGGCLAHKTGLGYGTFGLYLRYLVRQTYAV